jgi:hypothetical protein
MVRIRDAADDWSAIWPFFQEIVTASRTFAYDPEIRSPQAGYVGLHVMYRRL